MTLRKLGKYLLWTLLVSPFCCVTGCLIYEVHPWPPLAFDARRWREDRADDRNPNDVRARMSQSVLDYLKKPGSRFSRTQIESLLGAPDFAFSNGAKSEDQQDATGASIGDGPVIGYVTMNAPPFPQSFTEVLWIEFDSKGSFKEAWLNDGMYP